MIDGRQEWAAETVEDAIARALAELEVPRERVEVQVLDEGSGRAFMGLGKSEARVRVLVRPDFASAAQEFLRAVLELMGAEASCREAEPTERGYMIRMQGKDAGNLIGRHGQTLDALQQLTEVQASRRSGEHASLLLDVNDYRERRAEQIARQARRAAKDVARDGRPRPLEVMNPYERRLAHLALQDMPGIETESEGEDPFRRVVVRAADVDGNRRDDVDSEDER